MCRSGESEKSLRLVFDMAKALQPSLLFIVSTVVACTSPEAAGAPSALDNSPCHTDSRTRGRSRPSTRAQHLLAASHIATGAVQDEIDSLGQSRRGDDDRMSRRLLTELLLQLTSVAQEEGVYIFAATNRLQASICRHCCVTQTAWALPAISDALCQLVACCLL